MVLDLEIIIIPSGGTVVKNLPANAGDTGLIPGLGRFPRGGNGNCSSILARIMPWTEERRKVSKKKVDRGLRRRPGREDE